MFLSLYGEVNQQRQRSIFISLPVLLYNWNIRLLSVQSVTSHCLSWILDSTSFCWYLVKICRMESLQARLLHPSLYCRAFVTTMGQHWKLFKLLIKIALLKISLMCILLLIFVTFLTISECSGFRDNDEQYFPRYTC